ncbi:hypothetical protein [Acinetobacter terrae]|uniref:hypothetical protein n=1 Tax=Acinetobacter terrae TaxID=2731247 RepID=UPI00338E3534
MSDAVGTGCDGLGGLDGCDGLDGFEGLEGCEGLEGFLPPFQLDINTAITAAMTPIIAICNILFHLYLFFVLGLFLEEQNFDCLMLLNYIENQLTKKEGV